MAEIEDCFFYVHGKFNVVFKTHFLLKTSTD